MVSLQRVLEAALIASPRGIAVTEHQRHLMLWAQRQYGGLAPLERKPRVQVSSRAPSDERRTDQRLVPNRCLITHATTILLRLRTEPHSGCRARRVSKRSCGANDSSPVS